MHLITMAHLGEAQGVIDRFNLKKKDQDIYGSDDLILLITGEGKTLFTDHPFVRFQERVKDAVFLPPSRNLPEEILEALEECRMKVTHV